MGRQSHQLPPSAVPERPSRTGQTTADGGGQTEWLPKSMLGGALMLAGLRRGSLNGGLMALAGGDLIFHSLTGRHLHQALGLGTASPTQQRGTSSPVDAAEVSRTLTIGKSADELYRLWRAPATLDRVMGHVGHVTTESPDASHWVVHGPLGQTWEWDTRVVEDRPAERIRWESLPGAAIPNQGEVRFRPGPPGWGTEVSLRVSFDPPGGVLGDAALKIAGPAPRLFFGQALHRFKSLAETGEIPTLYRQPAARNDGRDI